MQQTNLSRYSNQSYNPAPMWKRAIWYYVNAFLIKGYLCPSSKIKILILRFFGARVGRKVVLKPGVSIKYPWKLSIGSHTWIGEGVWIDNLDTVMIGNHVCVSQGALLISGNHNYKKSTFDLTTAPIVLENGVWIGARAIVTQGVTCKSHSVLVAGAVASKNLEPYVIYGGMRAEKLRDRVITE